MSSIGGSFSAGGASFIKPEAPLIAEVQQELDALKGLIASGQAADGTVDLAALEQKIDQTGDPELRAAFRAIEGAFARPAASSSYGSGCSGAAPASFGSGCSGGSSSTGGAATQPAPKVLTRDEVQRVLADLAAARGKAAQLDQDGDGRLSLGEARDGARTSSLEGQLLGATQETFRGEVAKWAQALDAVGSSVDARVGLDKLITQAAHWHAKTTVGAEAIIACYRDLMTSGQLPTQPGALADKLDDQLWDAERGFGKLLRHLPIFGGKKDHLSDKEIGKLFGADDLAQLAKDRMAQVEARVGGDFQNHYLAGKDLAGSEHLQDPDYKRFSSRCA